MSCALGTLMVWFVAWISTPLTGSMANFDSAVTVSETHSGSLTRVIKSFAQVKAESPGMTTAQAKQAAIASGDGRWIKWFGRNFRPGEMFWV
jgi:hypothetical protein